MHILDELVVVGMGDRSDGYVAGVLERENSAVVSWAESLFERYRVEAELATPECSPTPERLGEPTPWYSPPTAECAPSAVFRRRQS